MPAAAASSPSEAAAAPRASDGAAEGIIVTHGAFPCARGYNLYTTTYMPVQRRTSACIVFHHGLSDHSARHANVLQYLCNALGIAVYTYDAHGHGRSGPHDASEDATGQGPSRALIRSFHHIVEDLLDFTHKFVLPAEARSNGDTAAAGASSSKSAGGKAADAGAAADGRGAGWSGAAADASPVSRANGETNGAAAAASSSASINDAVNGGGSAGGPQGREQQQQQQRVFLLGYSMGGLACGLAAAAPPHPQRNNAPSPFAGLLWTSSLTNALYGNAFHVRMLKLAYVSVLARLVPGLALFKRNPVEAGIRDPEAVADMAADKLWYRGKFKVASIASILWGCERLQAQARKITIPVYAQHGTQDVACSLGALRETAAKLGSRDVSLHVVEGAFHDLHHDPLTPELLDRMAAWLAARV